MKIKLAVALFALMAAVTAAAIQYWPVLFPPTWGSPWRLGPGNKMVVVFDDLSHIDDDSVRVRISYDRGGTGEVYVDTSMDCAPFRTTDCDAIPKGGEVVLTKQKGQPNIAIFLPSDELTAQGRWELLP